MIVDVNLPQKIETKLGGEYNVESVINDDGTQTLNINYVGSAYENKFKELVTGELTELSANDFDGITSLGEQVFYGSPNLISVELPETIKNIGIGTFRSCKQLTSIKMPTNMISIAGSVFRDCSKLVNVEMPKTLNTLGIYAFYQCSLLETVILPDGITELGQYTFYYCLKLNNVIIPDTVATIGSSCFSNCQALKEITIKAKTPPSLANTNAISTATTTIYIPKGTLEAYSTATNWSSFASKFVEKEM